jgi:hypothetical protein
LETVFDYIVALDRIGHNYQLPMAQFIIPSGRIGKLGGLFHGHLRDCDARHIST